MGVPAYAASPTPHPAAKATPSLLAAGPTSRDDRERHAARDGHPDGDVAHGNLTQTGRPVG
jgi:hypothetical protein